jgi:hypothetical protein
MNSVVEKKKRTKKSTVSAAVCDSNEGGLSLSKQGEVEVNIEIPVPFENKNTQLNPTCEFVNENNNILLEITDNNVVNVKDNSLVLTPSNYVDEIKQTKKRGRKPKGGKIIQQNLQMSLPKESKPNVILHLKCSMKDLQINNDTSNIESFHFSNIKNELCYDVIHKNDSFFNDSQNMYNENKNMQESIHQDCVYDLEKDKEAKEIWHKLKLLENNLHINDASDKKSACFWCTYNFDNPPIYIPKHFIKDVYEVYGCFCSPECAVAFLMNEHIDSSTKFERFYLLNFIYSKIYKYNKNIKPAPSPYYLLDKFYGNLSIHEYRSLLKSDRLFLVIDKPLTRILPEFHEDNDEFIINNKIIPSSNSYQVKKRLQKKFQTKNNILNEKFGGSVVTNS